MSDYMTMPLKQFAKELAADGIVDEGEVRKIRRRIYADGSIERDEADFLFSLNNAVSGANNHPSWNRLFVEALTDHFLGDKKSPGEVDSDEASYLIRKVKGDGRVDEAELALLVNIVTEAKKVAAKLHKYLLSSLKSAVLDDGVIDKSEVEMIRKVVFCEGGSGGAGVSRDEAEFLFCLNDGTSGKTNHASWKRLFVEALTSHVLDDDDSPGVVDGPEAKWLIARTMADGKVDGNERALLAAIKRKAKSLDPKLAAEMVRLKI